jgi:hypothetical protein
MMSLPRFTHSTNGSGDELGDGDGASEIDGKLAPPPLVFILCCLLR